MAFKLATHTPAADTAAVVTLSAGTYRVNHVSWSYDSDTPAGGDLTIAVDGTTIFTRQITATQANGEHSFGDGISFTANTSAVFTLPAGGSGVVGSINVSNESMQ